MPKNDYTCLTKFSQCELGKSFCLSLREKNSGFSRLNGSKNDTVQVLMRCQIFYVSPFLLSFVISVCIILKSKALMGTSKLVETVSESEVGVRRIRVDG